MHVINIRNPKALLTDNLQELLGRAFPGTDGILPPFAELKSEIATFIHHPKIGVMVGIDDNGDLNSFSLVMLPTTKIAPHPQILYFYSAGDDKLREATVQAVVDFVRENGYDTLWAINMTHRNDAAWQKLFQKGGKSRRIGSIMEVKIPKG